MCGLVEMKSQAGTGGGARGQQTTGGVEFKFAPYTEGLKGLGREIICPFYILQK